MSGACLVLWMKGHLNSSNSWEVLHYIKTTLSRFEWIGELFITLWRYLTGVPIAYHFSEATPLNYLLSTLYQIFKLNMAKTCPRVGLTRIHLAFSTAREGLWTREHTGAPGDGWEGGSSSSRDTEISNSPQSSSPCRANGSLSLWFSEDTTDHFKKEKRAREHDKSTLLKIYMDTRTDVHSAHCSPK